MKRSLHSLAVGATGAILLTALLGATGPLILRNDGIEFPDGTVQTTAAGFPTAWPMRCQLNTISSGTTVDLTCKSVLAVPGGNFGIGDGVPDGYFFLVTDVVIKPDHSGVTTGFIGGWLGHYTETNAAVATQHFKLASDLESQTNNFGCPLFVLDAGDYLRARNFTASTHTFSITVTGYLTDQPEKLRL